MKYSQNKSKQIKSYEYDLKFIYSLKKMAKCSNIINTLLVDKNQKAIRAWKNYVSVLDKWHFNSE